MSAEGRSKMLAQAQPLWARLPEGSLRLQVLADLAGKAALPVAQLGTLWAHELERQQNRQRSARGARDIESAAQVTEANDADPRRSRFAPAARPGLQRGRRPAPKRLEDHVLQMLFGQPHWWETLPSSEQDFLHRLPPPHGELIAWLERELSAHGVRPWAVLSAALADDATLDAAARELANADAEPDPSETDFRSALDGLLERDLAARMQTLLTLVGQDPTALDQYRALDKLWREVKKRLTQARPKDGTNPP
jgi:DNA primase